MRAKRITVEVLCDHIPAPHLDVEKQKALISQGFRYLPGTLPDTSGLVLGGKGGILPAGGLQAAGFDSHAQGAQAPCSFPPKKSPLARAVFLAERVGFEPTLPETGKPDFESGAFDHSATFPGVSVRALKRVDLPEPLGSKPHSIARTAADNAPRALQAGVNRSSPPRYARKAAGTLTEPSGCWPFSSTATSVRPTARPEPLRVCTNSVLPWALG